jgi:hypothetical protein
MHHPLKDKEDVAKERITLQLSQFVCSFSVSGDSNDNDRSFSSQVVNIYNININLFRNVSGEGTHRPGLSTRINLITTASQNDFM